MIIIFFNENEVEQGYTTQVPWRAKKLGAHIQGPKLKYFYKHTRGSYERSKLNKSNFGLRGIGLKASAGQYVVHA
jgi:hypothetical protein